MRGWQGRRSHTFKHTAPEAETQACAFQQQYGAAVRVVQHDVCTTQSACMPRRHGTHPGCSSGPAQKPQHANTSSDETNHQTHPSCWLVTFCTGLCALPPKIRLELIRATRGTNTRTLSVRTILNGQLAGYGSAAHTTKQACRRPRECYPSFLVPYQHQTSGRLNMFFGTGRAICWGRRSRYNACSGPIFGVGTVLVCTGVPHGWWAVRI